MTAKRTLILTVLAMAGVALMAPDRPIEDDRPERPPQPAPSSAPAAPMAMQVGNGFASRELTRSPDGHFYADAQVNGAQVRFLVDTGASFVALTRSDAQRAGIALGSKRATVMGVGGPIEVAPVTIDRIAIGPLAATAVDGAVAEDLTISLLGQSFLAQVGTVEIRGDRMVLR